MNPQSDCLVHHQKIRVGDKVGFSQAQLSLFTHKASLDEHRTAEGWVTVINTAGEMTVEWNKLKFYPHGWSQGDLRRL